METETKALFSPVQFDTFFNTRFSEAVGRLEELGLQSTLELSFGDGGRPQMVWKTVPDDRSATLKLRHCQISTFRRTETGSAREIRRRCAHVLETWGTGTSDTVECKEWTCDLRDIIYVFFLCF